MASAMPVLPEVGSISTSPFLIVPRSSARRIMDIAGRSFTEPAGLLPSSLARMTFLFCSNPEFKRCSRTSGVLPMKSSMVRFMPSGFLLHELPHIGGDAFFHPLEDARVARFAQPVQVRLRIALVL